ncbi:amidohydrolase family protein [Saccharopolyspora sp. TS4A08]|uniref:Amidohydrolase family protein n=1 Tax=Saccharopolyspora ipomoeae TaxID=3042027 RepID=A0ABT6PG96_9PSEU|nr:amidohydrolase family protein [Saccharopolyspora sp. TS4A08]MDI2027031.1 amidohydrolase family protein [Saccharopolyspora sp. TS4A08]
MEELRAGVEDVALVDHHAHGVVPGELDRAGFESLLTESDAPIPGWMTQFDSPLGFAVRRWCAPVLGLEPHASPEEYLAARVSLGVAEVSRRLLAASGAGRFLVDTGLGGGIAELAEASGKPVHEVVRLESVLEDVGRSGVSAAELPARFQEELSRRTAFAVGIKSIIAYRFGFGFDPRPPGSAEVVRAAGSWLRDGAPRVADPVLLRFALWAGVERGLPLQLHAGFGDPDLDLHRCDPLLLTGFLREVAPRGVDVLLLHCYPFHRNAAYLAQVFPHVHFDVGLAINHTGARATAVLAESLELAPFAKVLYSSDAWGLPELHHLGARLWRRGMTEVLSRHVDSGEWALDDALRVARMIGRDNAERVYGLGPGRC